MKGIVPESLLIPPGEGTTIAEKPLRYRPVDCRNVVSASMPLGDVGKAFDSLCAGENLLVALEP